MRFLIRIVAVLIMLFALGEMVVLLSQFNWERGSSRRSDGRPDKSETMQQLQELGARIHGPGILFCYGAVVFVLLRISVVQEQDAGPAPVPPPASPKPDDRIDVPGGLHVGLAPLPPPFSPKS